MMNDTANESVSGEDQRTISDNLSAVHARITAACLRANRSADEVRLLPVSKTVSARRMRAAFAAGLATFGENKVQEAKGKSEALSDLPVSWSIVGHLQTNKAKDVARFASEFQALDSLRIAEALERRLEIEDRTLDVLVQVNTSGETSKFGLAPENVAAFVRELPVFSRLRVGGLMTLAIFSAEADRVRRCFRLLREIRSRLQQDGPDGLSFDALSMGMSGDYEIAIEEGATIVRVGQAIFGPRPTPDNHYWPGVAGIG